ncbi:MAG: hypothetical protein V4505_14275 [Pseudomonadota bacterium]
MTNFLAHFQKRKIVTPPGNPYDMSFGPAGLFEPAHELPLRNFLSFAMSELSFEALYAYSAVLQYKKKPLLLYARMICSDFFLDESRASINIARGSGKEGIAFANMKSTIENLDVIQNSSARGVSTPADMFNFALEQLKLGMTDTFGRFKLTSKSSLVQSIKYTQYISPKEEEKKIVQGYFDYYEKAGLKLHAGLKLY